MATVALWHLGVTGILAGALTLVIMAQSLGGALRRLRHSAGRAVSVPVPPRLTVEPRTVRPVRTANDKTPVMASAAGTR